MIGVGAVGRQTALQLAAIGVRRLQLVDFDVVDATNVTTQGYRASDVGRLKVDAAADAVQEFDPALAVATIVDRWRPHTDLGDAAFCCVDSISAREAIWRGAGRSLPFWADGRMRGEVVRVFAAADPASRRRYAQSLFPQQEAHAGACTTRSTIYAASVAAGLLVAQFARWLRGATVVPEQTFDLWAADYAVADDS